MIYFVYDFSSFSHCLGMFILFSHFDICSIKAPIICGREPNATEEERKLGVERSAELSAKVNQVTLRLPLW